MAKKIKALEKEMATLEAKAAAFKPGGNQSAEAILAKSPDSRPFKEAAAITTEAMKIAVDLEKELKEFVGFGLDDERNKYLKLINVFSGKLLALWDISRASLFCDKFLPEYLRCAKPRRLVAPDQADLAVGVEHIEAVYKRLPKTAFAPV